MTSASARLAHERDVVRAKFPAETDFATVKGFDGWMFDVVSEFGDSYVLFAYWDGSLYQVKMVFPDPGVVVPPHMGHYFKNGQLCLARGVGMPTLEGAYSKAVLFVNAWSVYTRNGKFPF